MVDVVPDNSPYLFSKVGHTQYVVDEPPGRGDSEPFHRVTSKTSCTRDYYSVSR